MEGEIAQRAGWSSAGSRNILKQKGWECSFYTHKACIMYDLQCWSPNPGPWDYMLDSYSPQLKSATCGKMEWTLTLQLNAFIPKILWTTAALWPLAPSSLLEWALPDTFGFCLWNEGTIWSTLLNLGFYPLCALKDRIDYKRQALVLASPSWTQHTQRE